MNAGGAIQGAPPWTDTRPGYIMVRVKGVATDAGGEEETSLPVVV